MSWLRTILPDSVAATIGLRWFGFRKIPLLFYCRPSLVYADENKVIISIPLKRRTKNHLGSMYFGALCVGADCAAGLTAMQCIERHGKKVALIFKSLSARFIKRVEGDALFHCEQGKAISRLVDRAVETGERVELPVSIYVTVKGGDEERVAEFELVLSLKLKV